MHRELKFRAWSTGKNNHLKKARMIPFKDLSTKWHLYQFFNTEQYGCILMQFTGLKDVNGSEIYEGDIVACMYGTGKVIYILGCWMVEWIDDTEAEMELLGLNKKCRRQREDDERFEVIGNIYQNPELL